MKLLKYTIVSVTLASLLFTGCGNDLNPTTITNPDGTTTTVSIDSKQLKQGILKTTAKDGSIQSELTYKDDKIVSGYKIKTDSYQVKGNELTAQIKETWQNRQLVKTENLTDLSHEHIELMYRYGDRVVLKMKYPSQKILSNALLTTPQLITKIKNPPFKTALKVIEAYKGNVKLSDIKFGDLSNEELTSLYKVGVKYKKESSYLKYINSKNAKLAKKLTTK
jgi:major membrane immunogen (membrane-anchored lipoprotein)